MCSAPFCHSRSWTICSASASLSCSFSDRRRRSATVPPCAGPEILFSNPPLPASMNRSRQLEIVVAVTPCRRAASATDISPCNTANTTRTAHPPAPSAPASVTCS
jgi:hypothetical protein